MAPQMQQCNLRFTVRDHSMGVSLNVDREALGNAVMNLLENAVQNSPAGGLITLACDVTEDEVILVVSDEGPGIDPALHELVFEPFFTTRTEGTGLGLAIVHNLIRSMRGEIRIDSVAGMGARFTISLPRAEDGVEEGLVLRNETETVEN